jgi:chromate reductase, NAD(P)H dehydrogenase (quinone)
MAVKITDLTPGADPMSNTPLQVLLLAGSSREGALSVRLRDAAQKAVQQAGAQTDTLDLRALELPLYDGDLEAAHGVPDGARVFRDAVLKADALVFVTPEYNAFPTPLALNAWDWLSRLPAEGGLPSGTAATSNKPVALLSSSPGPLGGLRALTLVRQFLGGNFQMLVLPQQLAVGKAHEAFADDGTLKDPRQAQTLAQMVQGLLRLVARGVDQA